MSIPDLSTIDPYHFRSINPKNQFVTKDHIHKIFKKFGIKKKINDLEIYKTAFVHPSYIAKEHLTTKSTVDPDDPLTKEEYLSEINYPTDDGEPNPMQHYTKPEVVATWVPLQKTPYETLEFLGDSILGAIITDYIIERYPGKDEGFLTKLKTQLVRGTNLCILAKMLRFDRYVLISRQSEKSDIRKNDAVLEDVLEAFIGALFTDFGRHGEAFGICKDFVIRLMERYLNMNQMARRKNNYKDLLLQYFHKNFSGENPRYRLISTHGPTNHRIFKAGVINTDGHMITTGEGTKLVFAEQQAAKEALKYYGQEVYSDSEEPDRRIYNDSDSEEL